MRPCAIEMTKKCCPWEKGQSEWQTSDDACAVVVISLTIFLGEFSRGHVEQESVL